MVSGKTLLGQPAALIFLREFGITADPFRELPLFKEQCEKANDRYKDGKDLVRFQLESDPARLQTGEELSVLNLAGYLGMKHGETPLTGKWDTIIALGGARRAPLHRACYAAQALVDKRADARLLVIAGSTRLLKKEEIPLVQDYAPGATIDSTEYDLCVGAANKVLQKYPFLNVVTVCKDNPRAGNDDVIDQVMAEIPEHLGEGPYRITAVTTRIYVTGLELDMARAAKRHGWTGYGAAGHPTDPEGVFNRTIKIYSSECATIMRKAAVAAAEGC